MTSGGRVLGIETSCDETAAAVVEKGRTVVSSVVSSQVDLHARYGGVVPELAGRAHVELALPVVTDALLGAGLDRRGRSLDVADGPAEIDAVAATIGPGLIGALLVGVSTAKALALAWEVPFVGVNHLEGHLYAAMLEAPELELPVVVLLVSGGHSMLVALESPGSYEVLGATVDDAAGEAFDKVARYLGLGYPGGPQIDRLAASGDPGAIRFPRATTAGAFDFSFSGLKTAVVSYVRAHPEVSNADVAASFQEAVVDVLVAKSLAAAEEIGARGAALAGGVAANSSLRERFTESFSARGLSSYLPSRAMCTDNAAMIAAAGYFQLERSGPTPLDAGAVPDLQLHSSK
ncbi:MAG: tRNA (adenosine(37)-N6)-threonylcarbamoyltransferase complex transferase subunit TsaD [Acidimicrobiales bacterium]